MTNLILASAVLAASLAAEPAKPVAPAKAAVPPASAKTEPAKPPATDSEKGTKGAGATKAAEAPKVDAPVPPEKPKLPARPEALRDATGALLGPCTPEMAEAKLTAVEVLDGKQLNALRAKEKSDKPKADPSQRFIKIAYEAGESKGTSIRQITTHWMLTTEQAQKLLGEKVCVFQE